MASRLVEYLQQKKKERHALFGGGEQDEKNKEHSVLPDTTSPAPAPTMPNMIEQAQKEIVNVNGEIASVRQQTEQKINGEIASVQQQEEQKKKQEQEHSVRQQPEQKKKQEHPPATSEAGNYLDQMC